MNTSQLHEAITGLTKQIDQHVTIKVLPCDTAFFYLKSFFLLHKKYPSNLLCLTVNLDDSSNVGSHWIAFLVDWKNCKLELFDSLALHNFYPAFVSKIVDLFQKNNFGFITNFNTRFQALDSNCCGHYCIYFFYNRIILHYNFDTFCHWLYCTFSTFCSRDCAVYESVYKLVKTSKLILKKTLWINAVVFNCVKNHTILLIKNMDVLHVDKSTLQLKHPFRMLISGPSGIGKSRFVLDQIIASTDSINNQIKRIFYYYGTYDSKFHSELHECAKTVYGVEVKFEKGIGNVDPDSLDPLCPTLLIFDDLFMEIQQNQTLASYFTRETRHKNTSVVLIQQTIFGRGKYSREITLNCNYFVCFKNLID